MSQSPEHDAELARTGYPVPPNGDLSDGERKSLSRYGHWMESLSHGRLPPLTEDQRHFVAVAHGEADPQTPFEWAWVKLQLALQPRRALSPAEMSSLAHRLELARDAALDAQLAHSEKRQSILAKVQAELDALDAAEADRLRALDAEFSRLQEEIRAVVLARGVSYSQGRVKAVYYGGRATYDAKAMEAYALAHPEVNAFKKFSKAFVQLRFADGTPKPNDHA